jgi:hypothetical protein
MLSEYNSVTIWILAFGLLAKSLLINLGSHCFVSITWLGKKQNNLSTSLRVLFSINSVSSEKK